MIVYVWGNLTADNFTPRPGKDTVGAPGQFPGLSAWTTPPTGRKGQGVDVGLLAFPLKAFPDDVEQGGMEGHIAIAPANAAGEVDEDALNEWASARGTGRVHPLTQALLDAVVQPNIRTELT